MDHRADDLFVVDAEQAVKELAQYGEGGAELRMDRLIGSLAYFASVLYSIGLDVEANFASDFSIAVSAMDEGDGRRTARDFAALVQHQLEAIRQRLEFSDNRDPLERLRLRFELAQDLLQPSRAQPAERQVIDEATRAIAEFDVLATRLLKVVGSSVADPAEFSRSENLSQDSAQSIVSESRLSDLVESPPFCDLSFDSQRDVILPSLPAVDAREEVTNSPDATPDDLAVLLTTELPAPANDVQDQVGQACVGAEIDDEHGSVVTRPGNGYLDEVLALAVNNPAKIDSATRQTTEASVVAPHSGIEWPQNSVDLASDWRHEKKKIDAVFARALKVAIGGSWTSGFSSLFEAIDELDQINFVTGLPPAFKVSGKGLIRMHESIARSVIGEICQLDQCPTIELSAVSSTVLMSVYFNQPVRSDRMARIAAQCLGRLEASQNHMHWRLVLPASSRLLRVMPLKVEGIWVAVSWAQYMDVKQASVRGTEIKLMIGDVPDRLMVDDLGLVSVAVRLELPMFLRKRDRFRGLVMLADGRVLPLLG